MNPFRHKTLSILLLGAGLALACASPARQFRSIQAIASPAQARQALPPGARVVEEIRPLEREEVEPLVRRVVESWNTPDMEQTLGRAFYDKSRLLDTMDEAVPRDARLRLQSVQGIRTLEQYIVPAEAGGSQATVSIVSAQVRAQLEFNSPTGFRRLVGTNELLLRITKGSGK